jgi:UDP-N-acetylglucosamine acyltransferase
MEQKTNSFIHPTAVIFPNTSIGDNVYIGPYCIIGGPAEDKKRWGQQGFGVVIHDNATITGHVTIDEGTVSPTTIGKGSFIMKAVHIGHDSVLEDDVILSPHVIVGGHCTIGTKTNMGMGSIVHQRLTIPSGCMIGMNATVTKKTELEPNGCYIGTPAKWLRTNLR